MLLNPNKTFVPVSFKEGGGVLCSVFENLPSFSIPLSQFILRL